MEGITEHFCGGDGDYWDDEKGEEEEEFVGPSSSEEFVGPSSSEEEEEEKVKKGVEREKEKTVWRGRLNTLLDNFDMYVVTFPIFKARASYMRGLVAAVAEKDLKNAVQFMEKCVKLSETVEGMEYEKTVVMRASKKFGIALDENLSEASEDTIGSPGMNFKGIGSSDMGMAPRSPTNKRRSMLRRGTMRSIGIVNDVTREKFLATRVENGVEFDGDMLDVVQELRQLWGHDRHVSKALREIERVVEGEGVRVLSEDGCIIANLAMARFAASEKRA